MNRPYFWFFQAQTLAALMLAFPRGNHLVSAKSIRPDPTDGLCSQRLEEPTSTLAANAHSAILQLRKPVREGQLLSIKNLPTAEESNSTAIDIDFPGGLMEIGLELRKHARVFGAAFPPPELEPQSQALCVSHSRRSKVC